MPPHLILVSPNGGDHRSQRLLIQRADDQLDHQRQDSMGQPANSPCYPSTRHDRARHTRPWGARQPAPATSECHSGNRSGAATEEMTAADFTHVYDLSGGTGAWQTMGGSIATNGH